MLRIKITQSRIFPLTMILAVAAFFIAFSYQHISIGKEPVFFDEPTCVIKASPSVNAKQLVAEKPLGISVARHALPPTTIPSLPLIPPRVINQILPVYPFSALEKGIEGTVVLSVYIGSSGSPVRIERKISSGFEALDEAAENSVSLWKFEPAKRGTQSIGSWFEIPVVFRIK